MLSWDVILFCTLKIEHAGFNHLCILPPNFFLSVVNWVGGLQRGKNKAGTRAPMKVLCQHHSKLFQVLCLESIQQKICQAVHNTSTDYPAFLATSYFKVCPFNE